MKKERVIVEVLDDLTGEILRDDEVETFIFGWRIDGKLRWLEIDLGPTQAKAFNHVMARYVEHARERTTELAQKKQRGTRPRSTRNIGPAEQRRRDEMIALRNWARAQGLVVAERGRIPKEVRQAWEREFPSEDAINDARERWKEF